MRLGLLILLLPALSWCATFNAATGSRADVLAAIALTSAGDTVAVPADSESWSGDITISGITLRGPGKDAASPCTVTAGKVILTKHASQYTKLIGFRFTASAQHFALGGSSSSKPFVVESNYFNASAAPFASSTVNGGVIARNQFVGPNLADGFSINVGPERWATGSLMGSADTTGEGNIYIENNTFVSITEAIFDADNGARVVLRYNTITDSGFVVHGGGNPDQDTSDYGGHTIEVYNNTFVRSVSSVPVNRWMRWRGGCGIVASNVIPSNTSGDYPDKIEIELTVGCPNSYPMAYQVGQTVNPPENPPSKPLAIFGNTGSGIVDANFISIGENPNDACATPSNYIKAGRDYTNANVWLWAPYTIPHPVSSEASGGSEPDAPAPVHVLRIGGLKLTQ